MLGYVYGLIPIWLLAIPASGQSRIVCYAFVLFVPFLAAIPWPWLGLVTLVTCFWPVTWTTFDERGDKAQFGFVS